MKYHFKIHKSKDGYWADCLELEGCRSQGDSLEELKENLEEALNLYLSEDLNSPMNFSEPREFVAGKNIVEIEVDPGVALAMMVRQARLKMKKTQKEMMQILEIKNLSNYQRLEDPRRANPELKTLVKLTKSIPGLEITKFLDSYKPLAQKKKVG